MIPSRSALTQRKNPTYFTVPQHRNITSTSAHCGLRFLLRPFAWTKFRGDSKNFTIRATVDELYFEYGVRTQDTLVTLLFNEWTTLDSVLKVLLITKEKDMTKKISSPLLAAMQALTLSSSSGKGASQKSPAESRSSKKLKFDQKMADKKNTITKESFLTGLRHFSPNGTKYNVFSKREAQTLLGRSRLGKV